MLARISHHLTVEARHRPAMTALRLLAVLNVLFKYALIIQEMHFTPDYPTSCGWPVRGAERRAPCTEGPLTHFVSPRGEKMRRRASRASY